MSHHGRTHEPQRMEQIVTEFFAKTLHIILESRCPSVSSRDLSEGFRSRDKWFNLALSDCSAALENIDFCRQGNLESMIVDVILVQRSDCDVLNEKIMERWVLEYESKESSGNGVRSKSFHALYKKSILLLRSLYSTVRLLPAYKLFRDLVSSAQVRLYSISHRIYSFVEPFTRREEADMQQFLFTPIETLCGKHKLCLSVIYHSSVMDLSSELSTPLSPEFIQEYVGSPMAEPFKRYQSGLISKSSPSSPPFGAHVSKSLLRSKCVPVTKPATRRSIISSLPNRQLMLPSPFTKATRLINLSKKFTNSGLHQTASAVVKLFSLRNDEAGKMLVVKSSSKSTSRSSSRLSFQDDYDDSEFSGPFVVEDDYMTDTGSRPSSLDLLPSEPHEPDDFFPVKKSQDAALGALVCMLKKAPSLHSAISVTNENTKPEQMTCSNLGSSGLTPSKTVADALEDLRGYREMKDSLLLKQGKSSRA